MNKPYTDVEAPGTNAEESNREAAPGMWVSAHLAALRGVSGLRLPTLEKSIEGPPQRVARLSGDTAGKVADGGLAAPAVGGDLSLTQPPFLKLCDD